MKNTSILSLAQACDSLNSVSFESYLKYYQIDISKSEIEDLQSLVEELYAVKSSIGIFEHFYIGYKIPQIGKEFDLLRFGEDYVVNIELKRTSTEDKIRKQLIRNEYYLSYIGKKIYNLCYEKKTKKIYLLKGDDTLEYR